MKLLGGVFRSRARVRASAEAGPLCRRSRSWATAGSSASPRGRCEPGAQPRPARRATADVPRVVGVPMTARDVVLGRVRQAVAGAQPAPVTRGYLVEGIDAGRRVVEAFVDRVRDYRATVLHVDDAAIAAAEVLAAQGARRIGIPRGPRCAAASDGRGLVEDNALSPQELDQLDGALTTCAAACAVHRDDRTRRRAGAGETGADTPSGSPPLRRAGGSDRRHRPRARYAASSIPPPRDVRSSSSQALGDLRHRAATGRGRPLAASARRDCRAVESRRCPRRGSWTPAPASHLPTTAGSS